MRLQAIRLDQKLPELQQTGPPGPAQSKPNRIL